MESEINSQTFVYESGYVFTAVDLGNTGLRISLTNPDLQQDSLSIILPPAITQSFLAWVTKLPGTLSSELWPEFYHTIQKLAWSKKRPVPFKRGDFLALRKGSLAMRRIFQDRDKAVTITGG
jgi:hypothetical protein